MGTPRNPADSKVNLVMTGGHRGQLGRVVFLILSLYLRKH